MEETDSSFANEKETVTPKNIDEIIHGQSLNNLAEHQSKSQQSVPESQPISQQSVVDPQPISQESVSDVIASDEKAVRRTRSARIIKIPSRYKWIQYSLCVTCWKKSMLYVNCVIAVFNYLLLYLSLLSIGFYVSVTVNHLCFVNLLL